MPSSTGSGTSEPFIPLGPFLLRQSIGRGGMAEVWSGVHAAQQVPVAVKVMTGERARDPQYRAAFRNEVQATASLHHPGIVLVLDHGEVGAASEEASRGLLPAGSPYLAMELADGGTLSGAATEAWGWPGLRGTLLSLLDVLAHAHARGVVHRDLKPTNVLMFGGARGDREGRPPRLKLADFGLAQAFELQVGPDSTDFVCGTPTYMAPEQLRGEWRDYGPWTDLYSLGCMAWTLATGLPPFRESLLLLLVRRQLEEEPPAFEPAVPVPAGFEEWLRRLLAKEPGSRYVRAADATRALLGLGEPEIGPSPSRSQGSTDLAFSEAPTQLLTLTGLVPAAGSASAAPSAPSAGAGWTAGWKPEAPALPATWEHPVPRPPSMRLVGAGLGLYGLRTVPLVGRRRERDALWSALAQVHATGEARLVVLGGAAGNGKTRLAEWIAERAHEVGGATILRASHGPNPGPGDGLPRMLARQLRCTGLTRDEAAERLRRLLAAREPERDLDPETEAARLADLIAPAGAPAGAGAAQTAADRFALLERHLRRLARERPVLVVLDDVHWSVESIAFADHLLRRRDLPVLLLLTVRDDALAERRLESAAIAELSSLPGAGSLTVLPLPANDRAELVRELLGLSGELAAQVDERTGGNPLFAVQLVGDWVQRGVLEVGENGFVLRRGEEARFPDDLHEIWSGRVDRLFEHLPPGARSSLEIAAALGLAVDLPEWERACGAEGSSCPPALLEELIASHLAVRTEEGWCFVHPMLRESLERTAREGGRWASHHRACAAMLLDRAVQDERGVAERLGRHLLLAGQPEAALDFLLRGARERRETSDYAAALALLALRDEALDALATFATFADGGSADPRRAEGWVLRARIHLHQGQMAEVFRWAEQAAEGVSASRPEALRLLADACRRRGELDRAVGLYERCLAAPGHPHGEAASLWGLGDVARQRGETAHARQLFERSRRIYEEIGDEHGLGDHLIGLADLARQRRRAAEAEDLYRRALTLFGGLGNRYGVARAVNGLGEAARQRGEADRAAELYRRSLALLEALSSAEELFPRMNLALLALATERFGEARALLDDLRPRLEKMGWGGLLACADLAWMACAAGERRWSAWDDALDRAASTLTRAALFDPDAGWAAERAGDLAALAGEPARAREVWGLALAQWRGLGDEEAAARTRDKGQ